ncbi:MAG: hypothetical protein KY439_05785, partial [Actinobacteria bacterium]|nr:hypothetical protein [Actinomycetota bacterium]
SGWRAPAGAASCHRSTPTIPAIPRLPGGGAGAAERQIHQGRHMAGAGAVGSVVHYGDPTAH